MDRVKYVARWIAMVPCALAALLLAPSIVGAIFWITTLVGPVAFDLESFLDRLFFEAVSDGAGGAAFIFVGARIAPEPTARGRRRRRLRSSQSLRSPAHAHETGGRPTRVLREPRERGSGHAPRAQNG